MEGALSQLPADIRVPVRKVIRVVLLRASREVMDALRNQGWHNGYWRDEITGQDNGVRQLFASTTDKQKRRLRLRDIVHTLHEETRQIQGGIATLWHDEITPDMIEAEDIHVVEIRAKSVEAAQAKLKELNDV
jgi:hypothetical protein